MVVDGCYPLRCGKGDTASEHLMTDYGLRNGRARAPVPKSATRRLLYFSYRTWYELLSWPLLCLGYVLLLPGLLSLPLLLVLMYVQHTSGAYPAKTWSREPHVEV